MSDPIEMAHQAAEQLQGSCRHIIDLGPEFEAIEDNPQFCNALDQLVFCCDGCNWWFEISEMAEDWRCEECA